ncbi:hypothetical protein EJ05DRAFT_490501 [Pseudovirgaria hyperparasitica]|uniref:Uncharacterized protein n=1 Tax=Pseudovirgaria hyperparasitica TaxID=470096 RepID=A0A6A6VQN9_9PEZI|nr:uncharacterized protein EJ05DRAFT_490501 [Pseudovirgaria hyperparasitica]KAF2752968.1 hypothetical protein EJ05DRAFT_490501 [Pseudovirgaria hyperparasitica]
MSSKIYQRREKQYLGIRFSPSGRPLTRSANSVALLSPSSHTSDNKTIDETDYVPLIRAPQPQSSPNLGALHKVNLHDRHAIRLANRLEQVQLEHDGVINVAGSAGGESTIASHSTNLREHVKLNTAGLSRSARKDRHQSDSTPQMARAIAPDLCTEIVITPASLRIQPKRSSAVNINDSVAVPPTTKCDKIPSIASKSRISTTSRGTKLTTHDTTGLSLKKQSGTATNGNGSSKSQSPLTSSNLAPVMVGTCSINTVHAPLRRSARLAAKTAATVTAVEET